MQYNEINSASLPYRATPKRATDATHLLKTSTLPGVSQPYSVSTNPPLRQECPHRTNEREDRAGRNKEVIKQPLPQTDLVSEDAQVEEERQDDADSKAERGAHESHDAVEGREDDGDEHEEDDDGYADGESEDAVGERTRGGGVRVQAREELERGNDGAGGEGHFG